MKNTKTNSAALRELSDEELADQLVLRVDGIMPCAVYIALPTGQQFLARKPAQKAVAAWLASPAEE